MFNKELLINGENIPVSIIQSSGRKRTIGFRMDKTGLIIRTPLKFDLKIIEKFFSGKQKWIYESRLKQKSGIEKTNKFEEGESFSYKGENYKLQIKLTDLKKGKLEIDRNCFILSINKNIGVEERSTIIEYEINKRYFEKATEEITKEAENFISRFGFGVKNIIIKNYKSKYGQCKGNDIYFAYKIIRFPIGVIRHIILHELCHIKHKNHGENFWNLLYSLDIESEKHKKWLRENGILNP